MKKRLLGILLCICLVPVIMGGCGSDSEKTSGRAEREEQEEREEKKERKKKEEETKETEEAKEAEGTEETEESEVQQTAGFVTYVKKTEYAQAGYIFYEYLFEYEYDAAGNKIKQTNYNDGSVSNWIEYENDADGHPIKSIVYNADGFACYRHEYEYDDAENLIRKSLDGRVVEENEYDAAGNKIKQTNYNDGSVSNWIEYENDADGHPIKSIVYNADGSVHYRHEYEYDAAGNLVKNTGYTFDGQFYCIEENEYDAAGNQIKHAYFGGKPAGYEEYEYDAAGNLIKEAYYYCYYSDGNWDILAPKDLAYVIYEYGVQ